MLIRNGKLFWCFLPLFCFIPSCGLYFIDQFLSLCKYVFNYMLSMVQTKEELVFFFRGTKNFA